MRGILRRAGVALGVVALLAIGGVAVVTAPDSAGITAQFDVPGSVGNTITAREAVVRVTGVQLAETLEFGYGLGDTDTATTGVWVVVHTTVTTRASSQVFGNALLRIGGVSYGASGILPAPNLTGMQLNAGIPVAGVLVFEVPRSAVRGNDAAQARIEMKVRLNERLNTVPNISVDLTARSIESGVAIAAPKIVEDPQ